MILSHRQIKADKQHLDSNGKNVRQWIYEEEPLINEGDKEIPVKRLTTKADIKDRFRPLQVGDKVRWNEDGLSRMGQDSDLEKIKRMHGTVTGFVPDTDRQTVFVTWHTPNPNPGGFSSCYVGNLERSMSARADLKETLRTRQLQEDHLQESLKEPDTEGAKFNRGDKVKLSEPGLYFVRGDKTTEARYVGNVGTVLKSYLYDNSEDWGEHGVLIKVMVRWQKPVGTPDKVSVWTEECLELA